MMESVWPFLESLHGLPADLLVLALVAGCSIGGPTKEDIVRRAVRLPFAVQLYHRFTRTGGNTS